MVRDFFKAAKAAFGDAVWAKDGYMVTKPVTIKAMIRVCSDLAREDDGPESGRLARWEERLASWAEMGKQFKDEGFYEPFPANGAVDPVARIHRELAKAPGIPSSKKALIGPDF